MRSSLSSEDRKISRSSLGSADTSVARKSMRTPMESIDDMGDETDDGTEGTVVDVREKVCFNVQMKDRLLGWMNVYWGYKTQVEVCPLTPGTVYNFRIKAGTAAAADCEDNDWSDTFTTATKDDVISAASLHRALDQGHMTSARKVLALRISALEMPNRMGRTAVQVAAMRGDTAMCGMLVTCGADVNASEPGSLRSPLMSAAFRGAPDLMHVLTERDASPTQRDRFGQTALHYSCMQSHLPAVIAAVKDAQDINVKDNFKWSPLMLAVTAGASEEIIAYLLDNGADPNILDKRRQTVLMQAILSRSAGTAKLLIERGADVQLENCEGHTAYDFAKQNDMDRLLPLLKCKELPRNDDHLPKKRKQSQAIAFISVISPES